MTLLNNTSLMEQWMQYCFICKSLAILRVLSRTSVEQYRRTNKTTYAIGKELGVSYLLEGSFQKSGDNVRLIVQLIKASSKESHAWANEYDRNWKDIFLFRVEVAQTISKELHTIITPSEKELIKKSPHC